MKITATGIRNGNKQKIEVIDGAIFLNDSSDDGEKIRPILTLPRAVGGTFYPVPTGMMNIHTNLAMYYFDNRPEIVIEGEFDENIPYEDGEIY